MQLFRRRPRVIAALIGLISVLFMQLALAGYRCPTDVEAANSVATHAHERADVKACAAGTDKASVLCDAHCQPAEQALDKPHSPSISPFVPVSQARIGVVDPASVWLSKPSVHGDPLLLRGAGPSLAIRHCRFHI